METPRRGLARDARSKKSRGGKEQSRELLLHAVRTEATACGSSQPVVPVPRSFVGMKAKVFDRKFDSGENLTEHLDLSKARRSGEE
jgi:hypothetical protein